ncbi:hypothetical protein RSK20926_11004 [Roseobacter sp. SK209-2-6]|nr:hypothetical protein RSK20926_11004 [Roseobacter sp. SK209-2-6]
MLLQAKEVKYAKFEVQGNVLIYDTEKNNDEIRDEDISELERMLKRHSAITELRLNSDGGSVYAGSEMASIIIKHGLDTHVDGECISACVDVFLAGARRRMTLDSKIGFHQRSWRAEAVQNYYRQWRKRRKWATPFEFGSWIYSDTQTEVFEHLEFMLSRGVDAAFAIRTMQAEPSEEWYPSRLELIAAGVLREEVGAE